MAFDLFDGIELPTFSYQPIFNIKDVVWSDLDNGLNIGGQGDIRILQNVGCINDSIENILFTTIGERVMRRSFGSRLATLISEPLISSVLKYEFILKVKEDIERWERRIEIITNGVDKSKVSNLHVDNDQQEVFLKLVYRIIGYEKLFEYNKLVR